LTTTHLLVILNPTNIVATIDKTKVTLKTTFARLWSISFPLPSILHCIFSVVVAYVFRVID
jgi:hypothetical protein